MESKGHIMENLQKFEIARWLEKIARLEKALRAYQNHNRAADDTQAYLFSMGEWAFGYGKEPNPVDFGLVCSQETTNCVEQKP